MRKRVDVGTIMEHEGNINCLKFFENSHMFSCSGDGKICVWDAFKFNCLKALKGHKSDVIDIDVHPSGKILLSIGKDKTLRTWNLIKARCAFVTNLKSPANNVQWSPSGNLFAVCYDNHIDIYSLTTNCVSSSIQSTVKITTSLFLNVSYND